MCRRGRDCELADVNSVEECTELLGQAELDKQAVGSLAPAFNTVPAIPGLSASTAAAVCDEAAPTSPKDDKKDKKEKKAKKDQQAAAEEVAALPPLDQAQLRMKKAMREAQEARGFAVSLKALQFSNELVEQMNNHATSMEQTYQQPQALLVVKCAGLPGPREIMEEPHMSIARRPLRLQKLTLKKVNNMEAYRLLFELLDRRHEWYKAREKVARAMETAAKPVKEKKKKQKADADADAAPPKSES